MSFRTFAVVPLIVACAEGDRTNAFDMAPPPNPGGLTLSAPSTAFSGDTVVLEVTGAGLAVGEVVDFGFGSEGGSGFCPYRAQTGGAPCLDITGRVRSLGSAAAVLDGAEVVATVEVPLTSQLPVAYLQAFLFRGTDSATSQVQAVAVLQPWPDLSPRVEDLEDDVAGINGAISALETAVAAAAGAAATAASDLVAAVASWTSDLSAEASARTAGDAAAAASVTSEASTRSAADGGHSSRLTLVEGDIAVIEGSYLTLASVGTAGGTIAAGNDARFGQWSGGATGLNAVTGRASLGLGTAATSASSSFASSAQGATADAALSRNGGTMAGALVLQGAPSSANEATTRAYVDAAAPQETPYGRCAVDVQTHTAAMLNLGVCVPGFRGGMTKNAAGNAFVAPRTGVYAMQFTTHIAGSDGGCSMWLYNTTTGQRTGQNSPTNMANASGLVFANAGEHIGMYVNSCSGIQFGLPQHSNALFDYVQAVWVGP